MTRVLRLAGFIVCGSRGVHDLCVGRSSEVGSLPGTEPWFKRGVQQVRETEEHLIGYEPEAGARFRRGGVGSEDEQVRPPSLFTTQGFGVFWCFGAFYQTHIVAPRTPNSHGVI